MGCCNPPNQNHKNEIKKAAAYANKSCECANESASSAAESAASAASAAADSADAQEALSEFQERYMGAYPAPPVATQVGALYWNSSSNALFVWDGTSWVAAPSGFNEFTPFLATGTTTARNLATRTADMANVKDFGAVGDGVTDDTNAFVAAMDSGKDVIFVPSGTYNLVGNAYRAQGKLWIASPNTIYKNPTYPLGFKASSIWWGRVIQGAPYGPICIANLLKTPNEAGEALGLRLACNDFPPLTPGANGRVMLSSLVDNVDVPAGTLEVWAGNFVSNQIPGNSETRMIGIEVEVSRDMGNNTDASSNPWGGFNSNGIEVTGMAISPTGGKPTCAMRTWVNGSTGQNWFQHGIAISRTTTWGILFKQNPSGGVDTGTFLGGGTTVGACLRVEGNATNIISSTGNHVNIIDLSANTGGIGTFVRMPTNATSTAGFRNFANFDNRIDISSGDTISQQSSLFFSHAGTAKWQIGKLSDDRFSIYGVTNAVTPILINETGEVGINVSAINASATFQIDSTTKGFLPPRMTGAQRDLIASPTAGLVIYNTTTNLLNFYNGSVWGAV